VIDALDRLYCGHLVALHWSDAVRNRLEGQAAFLLSDQLAVVAKQSLEAAHKLADRIAELDGAVTADPTAFVDRSPAQSFQLPASTSDVGAILGYALTQVGSVIAAYRDLLGLTRDTDELTHRLALELVQGEVARESELQAVLGISEEEDEPTTAG
jgi:ferritin-like protein